MSDATSTAQRQQERQQGIFTSLLSFPIRFVAVLFGSLLLSIVIECVGMYALWPEEGWRHSQQMFEFELNQFSNDFKRSALVQEPGRTTQELIQIAYSAVFESTGMVNSLQETSQRAQAANKLSRRDGRYYVGSLYISLENGLIAAAYTFLVFVVRLLVLFLSLPLFAMAVFIGIVDGLVCRDIRRFGAGRESGYVYHRAKACVMPLATLPWVIYLSIPVSVEAALIIVPGAFFLGCASAITARNFKKYL
ncbi:TIGR03747 family integrating conjugative element membrane protein [Pseudomonas sp. 91RF]|jgi:integrating conjugative element membrane protein (TIGR03747 family)|uniref:TIGR03747 family integrating conjugative element membrane protein n=1 Tax=Pseudomonas sp. 91RF TaxID=2292261 RepID=UPI000E66AEAA|nr:TIGR03747 family integrating conjugative element membrane protein [Pseudomonas sp. 91RF]RIJ09682.1 TIGR03747 family integrating conjugative element membrane protein [Pseudomonas sp. 91RF]